MYLIDDRPWEMLSKEEQDAIYIKATGEPYHPLTEEERQELLKEIEENHKKRKKK